MRGRSSRRGFVGGGNRARRDPEFRAFTDADSGFAVMVRGIASGVYGSSDGYFVRGRWVSESGHVSPVGPPIGPSADPAMGAREP